MSNVNDSLIDKLLQAKSEWKGLPVETSWEKGRSTGFHEAFTIVQKHFAEPLPMSERPIEEQRKFEQALLNAGAKFVPYAEEKMSEIPVVDQTIESKFLRAFNDCDGKTSDKIYRGLLAITPYLRTSEPVSSWLSMTEAPTDGIRIALQVNEREYHGWWENNFGCWMGMDAEWNLLQLHPTGWRAL